MDKNAETKHCDYCDQTKQINDFNLNYNNKPTNKCNDCVKTNPNGKCHICDRILPRNLFPNRGRICNECLEKEKTITEIKCKTCGITKSIDNFLLIKRLNYRTRQCGGCCYKYKLDNFEDYRKKQTEFVRSRNILNPEKRILATVKSRTAKDGIPFNLTLEDIIIPEFCPVLGIKLKKGQGKRQDNSVSIDRIIPELGYVKGNIRIISWRANKLKNNGKIEEFEAIIKYMKNPFDKIAENV